VSGSKGYVETAFKVTVEKRPEKMKCVPLGDIEFDIGFVRSELRGKGCPSIITKKGNETYLCFLDSTQQCSSYIKGLCKGGCSQKEINVERADVEKLAHEVARIKLMRHGYRVIKGKLVNVDSLSVIVPGYFNKFDAYKTSLTHFHGEILLAIDKSFKLEPDREASLSKISEKLGADVIESLGFVKVIGGDHRAFKPIGYCDNVDLARRMLRFLNIDLDRVDWSRSKIVKVQPHHLALSFIDQARKKDLLLMDDRGNYYTCLPDTLLYLVASLDNIKVIAGALGRDVSGVTKLTLPPQTRLDESLKLVRLIAGTLSLGGLEIHVDDKPLLIYEDRGEVLRVQASLKKRRGEGEEVTHKFTPGNPYEPIVAPRGLSEVNVAIIRRSSLEKKHLGNKASVLVDGFKQKLRKWLASEAKVKVTVEDFPYNGDLLNIDEVVEEIRDKGFNAHVVIAPVSDEREYAFFEYGVARKGLIPQALDLSKKTPKGEPLSLMYGALPIARHIEYKLGFRLVKIDYPPMLKDYVVVAVDATPLMFKGYSKLGVAPVLMDPSGLNLEYLDLVVGGNEEEVLDKVLDILSDKLRYRKVLIYVNRASVPQDILDRYVDRFKELLVVAFSKRGVPRLLKLQSEGQEDISVSLPEGGSFVKHGVTSSGSFNVYHYIGVTNTIERDDLTPITVTLRVYTRRMLSGSEERALLGYVQSSTGIYVESPYNLPSLPQPLHEAHRLSRKLYKISRWGVRVEKLKPEVLGRL
jgi:hypothetical protein